VQPTVTSRGEVQKSQAVTDLWHLQYCCLGSFHLKKFGVVSAVMSLYEQLEIWWWSRHMATLHRPPTTPHIGGVHTHTSTHTHTHGCVETYQYMIYGGASGTRADNPPLVMEHLAYPGRRPTKLRNIVTVHQEQTTRTPTHKHTHTSRAHTHTHTHTHTVSKQINIFYGETSGLPQSDTWSTRDNSQMVHMGKNHKVDFSRKSIASCVDQHRKNLRGML
jgi:hypothetical protein